MDGFQQSQKGPGGHTSDQFRLRLTCQDDPVLQPNSHTQWAVSSLIMSASVRLLQNENQFEREKSQCQWNKQKFLCFPFDPTVFPNKKVTHEDNARTVMLINKGAMRWMV